MPKIIDLRNQIGNFETNPQLPTADGRSVRQFGLWNFDPVCVGDYVVRPQDSGFSILQITKVNNDPFKGSDGNKFWTGVMEGIDVDKIYEHPDAVKWLQIPDGD